ncbi:MAG: 50S ribosomal protein L25 [Thermodesulfobacteriota bacterium]|nr:MAG: 50S ribosomal protein L25 [Thermodesulfobacteriota bacterium]
MEKINLSAEQRNETGNGPARRLRANGKVPGILYGPGIEKALAVTLEKKELDKTLGTGARGNVLVNLDIAGDKVRTVMFKEVLRHPLKGTVQHVDLLEVQMDHKVVVEVPVHLTGKAAGLAFGGIVQHETRRIRIECLPGNIPDSIDVDITRLGVGDSVHVRDIALNEGLEAVDEPELTVVSVVAPTAEAAPRTAEEVEAELAKSFEEKEGAKKEE